VEITPLSIAGSFVINNAVHGDERGEFVEWFRADHVLEHTGLSFSTIQANLSVSQKGTLRGVHFADVPPGQAKYVMCATGAIQDYVVDIRVGSPTFGQWEATTISAEKRNAILLDVGLGHAFLALEEGTTVTYLVTDHYKPQSEHAINPMDEELGLEFPLSVSELLVSEKDREAPSFAFAHSSGMLPRWQGR
jgi:dTDP-4-dehydrorhamnose 3,5-epimerase